MIKSQQNNQELMDIQMKQMMMKSQPGAQEPESAPAQGIWFFNLKGLFLVLFLILDTFLVYAAYVEKRCSIEAMDDYRIISCRAEEEQNEYVLYVEVQSQRGQEQTVVIYLEDEILSPYMPGAHNPEAVLPAYATATWKYRVPKSVVKDGLTLYLHTYEEQEWTVELP